MLLTDRALELVPSEIGKRLNPFHFHSLQFLGVEIEETENCGRDKNAARSGISRAREWADGNRNCGETRKW